MNRIVVLGDGLFVPELLRRSIEVVHLHPASETTPFPLEHWTGLEIAKYLLPNDILLISGAISPVVFPASFENIRNPVVCYLPDAPLHRFWMSRAATSLTRLVVDQPQEVSFYRKLGINAEWLPLAADPTLYHAGNRAWNDRDIDFLFVGTVDPARRLKRSKLLKIIQSVVAVTILDGGGNRSVPADEVAEYYRRAKVIINENMFPSVNLRMFEAMASGAMLFTEETDCCWSRLFTDGKHFLTFNAENLRERVRWIKQNLASEVKIIAEVGRREVENHHLLSNRVDQLLAVLLALPSNDNPLSRLHPGVPLRMALRWSLHPQRDIWLQSSLSLLAEDSTTFDKESWLDRVALMHVLQKDNALLDTLKEAIKQHPNSLRLRVAIAWQQIAAGSNNGYAHLRQALRIAGYEDFSDTRLRTELGYCHFATANLLTVIGEDFDPGFLRKKLPVFLWKAMEHYQQAVELSPDDEEIRCTFARFLQERFAVEEAAYLLEHAPNLTVRIREALALLQPELCR
ncbi:MAG: glycosyltransferase [bacterium]|nr:glycosyltransferase [bacterium]